MARSPVVEFGTSIAVLFPGQASQEVGMGAALRRASPAADRWFRLAEEQTGLPIGDLCANGPLVTLTRTDVAQTAVVVTSLAAASYLEELLGGSPAVVAAAGHSVGELSAMCWAGALDPATTIRLVHARGKLMQRDAERCDGTMVAVLGLEAAELIGVCADVSTQMAGAVSVANFNAPGQLVLSGERASIEAASRLAREAGARRVLPLNVGGPFHSRYMEAAARDFRALVQTAPVSDPRVPIVLNTTGQPTMDPAVLRGELWTQVTAPVRWDDSLRTLAALSCDSFIELGPGQVLTGLVRRTVPDVKAMAADGPEALAALVESLQGKDRAQ